MTEGVKKEKRINLLTIVLLLAVITILLFPFYVIFYQNPAFTELLKENTQNEAILIATTLIPLITSEVDGLEKEPIPDRFIKQLQVLRQDLHFIKFKIFLTSGEIIYSTDPDEIGKVNSETYFSEITSLRKIMTKEIEKNKLSLENQIMLADVVETYVPIMKDNKMLGVFEIYYNISEDRERLHALLDRSSVVLLIIALFMLSAVILSTVMANRYLAARDRAETERERVILELRYAIAEIRTLSGLLPMCAWCKKIRNDQGYWKQVEEYVCEHSMAEITHGICPECKENHYGYIQGKQV